MRPCRSLHAFGSQKVGQPREEHLPFLGGVGRRTHDLCCERKSRHTQVLRSHFGVAAAELRQGCSPLQRVAYVVPRFSLGTGNHWLTGKKGTRRPAVYFPGEWDISVARTGVSAGLSTAFRSGTDHNPGEAIESFSLQKAGRQCQFISRLALVSLNLCEGLGVLSACGRYYLNASGFVATYSAQSCSIIILTCSGLYLSPLGGAFSRQPRRMLPACRLPGCGVKAASVGL
jgi:hypothetical protein